MVGVARFMGFAIFEEKALVLWLVGLFQLRPELAISLQCALVVAGEVILDVKVVHIQNVLAARFTDVVGVVTWWNRMRHGQIYRTCCALFTRIKVLARPERKAFHVVSWAVMNTIHGEEVTVLDVLAALLTAVLVRHIKVEHVQKVVDGGRANSGAKGTRIAVVAHCSCPSCASCQCQKQKSCPRHLRSEDFPCGGQVQEDSQDCGRS